MATTEEIIIKVKGDISELEKDLANLKGQMASIQNTPISPTVTPTVNTTNVTSTFTSLKNTIKGKFDEITGGIASQLGQIGTSARAAFTTMRAAGVSTFRAIAGAIASTGIGALVVAVGIIAANFDKIKALINGISSEQKNLNELAKANLQLQQQKEKLLAAEDNINKLRGKSEREILLSKIEQKKQSELATLEAIKAAKITLKAQLEAEIRNQRILGGILNFIAQPIDLILLAIDSIGSKFGQNFNLAKSFKDFRDTLLFDPKAIDEAGKKELAEWELQYKEQLNQRAGYVIAIGEIDKKANDKSIKSAEKAAEEERKYREKSNENLRTLRSNNTLDAIKDSEQRALKQLEIEDKKQRDEIALLKISNDQKIALYKELDIKLEQARADILTKQREKNYEAELKKVEENFNKEEIILKEQLANNLITETEYNNKISELQLSELEAKQFVATNWSSYVKKASEDATAFEQQSNDKRLDNIIKNNAAKKEEQAKAYENELKLADDLFKQEALALKTKLANGEISEQEYGEKIKDLESKTLQSKISIAGKFSRTVKKAEEDITTFTNEEADKRLDKTIENNKKNSELLKQQLGELAAMASQGILVRLGINPQDADRLTKSLTDIYQKIKERKPIDAGEIAETAGSAYFAVSNAIAASDAKRREEELAALQVQQEEELRLAGDNEQKKDIIRQKYALKEKEIKRKQAEADKKKAIMDATIKTAVAVITAISQSPLTFGMPWAAIVAALGAAEIAMIAATPIPKFAKGVVSFDGKGGLVKGEGTGTSDSNLAYLSKGESVIPAAPTSANLGLINELVNGDVDSYINRHYVMPALQAKEIQAANNYRHSVIEAENNLIARVSSSTLKSIDRRLVETNNSIKGLAKKDYSW